MFICIIFTDLFPVIVFECFKGKNNFYSTVIYVISHNLIINPKLGIQHHELSGIQHHYRTYQTAE